MNAQDWLQAALGLPPWKPGDCFVVLNPTTYTDESGLHEDAPYCVMAGYVALPQDWLEFDKHWNGTLEEYGAGKREFHAKKFFLEDKHGKHRCHPYRRWERPQSEAFIAKLASTTSMPGLQVAASVLDVLAFKALSLDERRLATGATWNDETDSWEAKGNPSRPWFSCLISHVGDVAAIAPGEGRINFVFDRQDMYEKLTHKSFEEMKRVLAKTGRRLGPVTFDERAESPALQAADLAAHCYYKYSEAKAFGEPLTGRMQIAFSQLAKNPGRAELIDAENLRVAIDVALGEKRDLFYGR